MMKRLMAIVLAGWAASAAFAESSVLPGSINFNTPGLWGHEVMFGFDDDGNYVGRTFWYLGSGNKSGATVRRHAGTSTGYLQTVYGSNVHRTVAPLSKGESEGPDPINGQGITESGIYVDTMVTLAAYPKMDEPKVFDATRDKINCWICIPEEKNGAETNFIITAGSPTGPKNYVTDLKVSPGKPVQLVIRSRMLDGKVVFEVSVNGIQATSGEISQFPSLLPADGDYGTRIYSMGVDGAAQVEKINFTGVDPQDDPSYDQDDLSMLREYVDISVDGFESTVGLMNFPMLVRVSEEKIKGFHYARTAANGTDIRFTDENGKLLPHDIDTWNPEGESLIWVKVPYMMKGTRIRMHWALKRGFTPPVNVREDVWSDYVAVWHFSDAARGQAEDATGHGFTAKMLGGGTLSVSDTSVFGVAGAAAGGKLESLDYEARYPVRGKFTLTGWYMAKNVTTFGTAASALFGKKGGTTPSSKAFQGSEGWCGLVWASTTLRFYFDGVDYLERTGLPDLRNGWFHTGFVYSNGSHVDIYSNGSLVNSGAAKISPNATNFTVMAAGALADEIRISRMARSAEWIKAEYEQAILDSYTSYAAALVKDSDNYWVIPPSVEPNSASVEEADKIVVNPGQPRFGTVILSFVNAAGVEIFEQPTAPGNYKAVATVKGGYREGLRKEIPFVIYDKRGYHNLKGYDRAMLFNSDSSPEAPVSLQGYYDIDSTTNKVWTHEGDDWAGIGDFVLDGTTHVYYEPETGRRLWEFHHARIGNLFRDDYKLTSEMNFLPWGGHARRFDDSEMPASRQRHAGTLIFQNISTDTDEEDPAGAYSPIFEDGIGVLYFDAVNAFCGYRNRVKVQICGTDDDIVTDGEWTDVPLDVFAIKNGVYEESMSTTGVNEAVLDMDKIAGTTNWFYRIRANIDTNLPVRVRIIRTDSDWSDSDDSEGLIEIDNIIVSYPGMGVRIGQFGAPAEPDNFVLRGQRAPFDIAFPTAKDLGSVHALVKVDYIANNTNTVDASFVGAINFRYRWRYLNQIVDDWQELLMVASPDDPCKFVSVDPIEGMGTGDIEYNADAVVNAPFYEYWDYSGGTWQWPDGFSERRGNVILSAEADGVYSPERRSPALGTDYFVRLRDGRSDYQGFRLYVKKTGEDVSKAKVYEMTLASDNTWRAFHQTLDEVKEGLQYRIEAYNRQTATGCDYQYNSVWLHGNNQTVVPVNDVLNEGGDDVWTTVPCDALTGYLMFQVEDITRSLVVIHSDYQNFNAWTDAYSPVEDPYFIGTSALLPTAGVSQLVKSYNETFTNFTETVSSNALWIENFDIKGRLEDEFPIEVPFSDQRPTPAKWFAKNGMWVYQNYRQQGDSIALQMMGEGLGEFEFPANCNPFPRGAEYFTYRARLAQTYDIHSFDFYTGAGTTNDVYNLNNYTFVANVAMTLTNDTECADFDGLGAVSLVARYRESKGGYEFRVERTGLDAIQLCLYKWAQGERGTVSPTLLGRSPDIKHYSACGLNGIGNKVGAMFISCTNTESSVYVTAGLLVDGRIVQNEDLSGRNYYKVSYVDSESDRHLTGTFGLGSKDCPATFMRPQFTPQAVAWATDATGHDGDFRYWTTGKTVTFKMTYALIEGEDDYDAWNIYRDRLDAYDYLNPSKNVYYGFRATIPSQCVLIKSEPKGGGRQTTVATNVIHSFTLEEYRTPLYLSDSIAISLKTAGVRGDGSCDVVVDEAEIRQWRGLDYDDPSNPDRDLFRDYQYGAPTNFVYTTAWIAGDSAVELSPMRTTAESPAGIRAPLMDGLNGRGLGLGSISIAYRNADPRARLLVQIATNEVSRNVLHDLTTEMDSWETVQVFTFDEMTEDELLGGILNCYIGMHGVTGVMRVIVDPTLAEEARDPSLNPGPDPAFGRVYVTMAGAKDNPKLDNGSWWGWNLRTTGDPSKKLLQDGTLSDTRTDGLSYGLNNSVVNDVREDNEYRLHMPFLQTPLFTHGVIGEVSFKARKYEAGDYAPTVAIYGTQAMNPDVSDAEFEYLGEILIDCDRYETFTFKAPISRNFTAFRLAVTGVDGLTGDSGRYPASGRVRRVLIDEVAVFEAIKARLGFRNVGAFRSRLADNWVVPNMPCKEEQPLCEESWGVQTELYAAQLSDKIDLHTPGREPRVYFHWFRGTEPWGANKWMQDPSAGHGELARAEGATNLVYRAGYLLAPEAIVQPEDEPGTIYQFSLDVVYYMEGQDDPLTNSLSAADWVKPPWYEPIDCNEQYGKDGAFSAYNILDTVSPGWAWFNEVNLFGGYNRTGYQNVDSDYQYLEIAVPAEADLKDWSVRFLLAETGSLTVRTNLVATFGYGSLKGTKQDNIGMASGMVFRVIASLPTQNSGKLKKKDGTLDGTWSFLNPDGNVFRVDGTIAEDEPFGIQLVRPTGIVEHEIVVIGTNYWGMSERYADQYDPSNTVNFLNKYMKGAHFVYVGDDDAGESKAISVWDSRGEASNFWDRVMIHTPGRINTYADGTPQILPSDHPTPFGSSIYIYANLGTSGHIYQTCGDAVDSVNGQVLVIQRGSETGTDIVYRVDRWYELGTVTTNNGIHTERQFVSNLTWRVNVGRGASNNVTVVANAQVCEMLRKYGVDENNRYTPAIIDWFEHGVDMYGNKWPNYEEGTICPAWFLPYGSALSEATQMTLTQMYWLDMCPMVSNQYFIAGFSDPSKPIVRPPDPYLGNDTTLTNIQMTVYMAISNGMHATESQPLEAPYVIRGITPGTNGTSWAYADAQQRGLDTWEGNWTNASFKITGILANGRTSTTNEYNWVPLRWFVFDKNSFDPTTFTSKIEVADPYSPMSPGYYDWHDWIIRHGWTPSVWFGWAIDERMRPFEVEILKPDSTYKNQESQKKLQ